MLVEWFWNLLENLLADLFVILPQSDKHFIWSFIEFPWWGVGLQVEWTTGLKFCSFLFPVNSWHKVSKTKHVRTCEEYMWANNDARDSAGCVKLEGLVKDRMYLQTVLQIIWEFWAHLGSFEIIWDHGSYELLAGFSYGLMASRFEKLTFLAMAP